MTITTSITITKSTMVILDLVLNDIVREELLSPASSLRKPLFSGEGFSWCGRAIEVQSIYKHEIYNML